MLTGNHTRVILKHLIGHSIDHGAGNIVDSLKKHMNWRPGGLAAATATNLESPTHTMEVFLEGLFLKDLEREFAVQYSYSAVLAFILYDTGTPSCY